MSENQKSNKKKSRHNKYNQIMQQNVKKKLKRKVHYSSDSEVILKMISTFRYKK